MRYSNQLMLCSSLVMMVVFVITHTSISMNNMPICSVRVMSDHKGWYDNLETTKII